MMDRHQMKCLRYEAEMFNAKLKGNVSGIAKCNC